jgi:translation initiation factor 3 subunit A
LKTLIQIRLNLLDTATELEQWQEAFKTAEDIIFLMDKYEKLNEDERKASGSRRLPKIPSLMKLDFYSNIEKLLWISDYYLYHAHCSILVKELSHKSERQVRDQCKGNPEKFQSQYDLKLAKYDIENVDNKIILATLSTPFKNLYTNYMKIGDELFEYEKDIETETCSRMMHMLKLNVVPSKRNLLNFIQNNKLLEKCDDRIKELFNLLENETNPFLICRKGFSIVDSFLKSDQKFEKYSNMIIRNIIIKSLTLMPTNYETISFTRLEKLFQRSFSEIEDIIVENSRTGAISCEIDHARSLINFKSPSQISTEISQKLKGFVSRVEDITENVLKQMNLSDPKRKTKLSKLRTAIYLELEEQNTNSLSIYDKLIELMSNKQRLLKEYIERKTSNKIDLREKRQKEILDKKIRDEENARGLKEIAKDEEKQKEFDIQVKKYVIERIKIFTNVVTIDGKKVKLDEILKDMNKYTDEQLIKLLEAEEINFKTKKEKKFKQVVKDTDYIIREFRRRDYAAFTDLLKKEETIYNEVMEAEHKRLYEDKIGYKSHLKEIRFNKENYFNQIMNERESEFDQKMGSFKDRLDRKVHLDLKAELGKHFNIYYDDFKKAREREQQEKDKIYAGWKNPKLFQQRTLNQGEGIMGRSTNFRADNTGPRMNLTENVGFQRSANYVKPTEEAKVIATTSEKVEFKRGEKFVAPTTEPKTITKEEPMKIIKGSNVKEEKPLEKMEFKRSQPSTTSTAKEEVKPIVRGVNAQQKEEKKEDGKINLNTNKEVIKEEKKIITKDQPIVRGSNATTNTSTTSTSNTIEKGGFSRKVAEEKKEEKPAETKGWGRGPATTKPVETKPTEKKAEPITRKK